MPEPRYSAVMLWVPVVRLAKVSVACPLVRLTGLLMLTSLFLNCICPSGVPLPGDVAVTVAVKVTLLPKKAGFRLEVRLVLVLASSTV